jgi:hypothetical protein
VNESAVESAEKVEGVEGGKALSRANRLLLLQPGEYLHECKILRSGTYDAAVLETEKRALNQTWGPVVVRATKRSFDNAVFETRTFVAIDATANVCITYTVQRTL